MSQAERTTEQILESAQRSLDIAELGYATFVKQPEKRLVGLMNLTVFGVSVTAVLQNLRNTEADFDKWYEKYKSEMKSDPLMKYFWNLRSEILKEGKLVVASNLHIKSLNPLNFHRIPPPPSNAKVRSFFMGDPLGGNGYEIELGDGSIQKYYVEMPSDIAESWLEFADKSKMPRIHLGKKLESMSIQALSRLYLDYLQRMAKDARATFGKTK